MKWSLLSIAHIEIVLCACLAAGCADDKSTCYAEDASGARVKVPCRELVNPRAESLPDAPPGGCQTPDDCGRITPFPRPGPSNSPPSASAPRPGPSARPSASPRPQPQGAFTDSPRP